MSLPVTTIEDNPTQVVGAANFYVPDQLIAGNMKITTDSVTLTGGAALQRGTVLGCIDEATPVSGSGTAYASGTIAVAAVPTAADTVTVNGAVYTFQTPPGSYQEDPFNGATVYIQATTALTAQAFMDALEAATDANTIKMNYSLSGATITATSKLPGTAGNAYTLATSDSSAFTVSGGTLSGGVANTGNATIGSINLGPAGKPGNYKAVCLTATTAQVTDPNGAELGVATFGTAFSNAQIGLTISAGGTPCVAGDMFIIGVTKVGGLYQIAKAGATDGSQAPAAILVDYSDASAGNLTCGVYLEGEFNAAAIILDPSISVAAATAALRPLGIFLKTMSAAMSSADPT